MQLFALLSVIDTIERPALTTNDRYKLNS